jgi:uncharacterized membrane protein
MGVLFRRHVIVGAVVGIAVFAVLYFAFPKGLAPTLAWDAAAGTFLVLTWRHIWPLDAEATRAIVGTEAPDRTALDLVVIVAAVLSLVTVVAVLFRNSIVGNLSTEWRAALGILAVVLAWFVVHTVYTLRYARLYYADPVGGIDFNGPELPAYSDFAYIAFGIGMAFQVADTNLKTRAFRKTVLAHALLSFMFVTMILAVTINLIAGLKP